MLYPVDRVLEKMVNHLYILWLCDEIEENLQAKIKTLQQESAFKVIKISKVGELSNFLL